MKPKYSFGYGLSYTTFDIHPESLAQDGRTLVSEVTVRNTGSVQGAEVVQIYVSVPEGSAGAEAKRLVGFARTSELGPGREEKLTISFPVDALLPMSLKRESISFGQAIHRPEIRRIGGLRSGWRQQHSSRFRKMSSPKNAHPYVL